MPTREFGDGVYDPTDPDRMEGLFGFTNPYFHVSGGDNYIDPNQGDFGVGTPTEPGFEENEEELTFEEALEQYWRDNPDALEEAIEANPEAFGIAPTTPSTPSGPTEPPGWAEVLQGIVEGSTGVGQSADEIMADWIGGSGIGGRWNIDAGTFQDLLVGSLPGPLTTSPIILEDVLSDIAGGVDSIISGETSIDEAIANAANNVRGRVEGVVGGAIDDAGSILSGVGNVIGGLVDNISSQGDGTGTEGESLTLGGTPPITEEDDVEEVLSGDTTEPNPDMTVDEVQYNPDAVYGWDNPEIDPSTGERYLPPMENDGPVYQGMGGDGQQRRTPLDEPQTPTTSATPPIAGGGGGNTAPGSITGGEDFMAQIAPNYEILQRRQIQRSNLIAGLFDGLL